MNRKPNPRLPSLGRCALNSLERVCERLQTHRHALFMVKQRRPCVCVCVCIVPAGYITYKKVEARGNWIIVVV